MNTADITLTIFILWMFGSLHAFSQLMMQVNKIKDNWTDYRCKPTIMPFANVFGHDTMDNFRWCIQHIGSMFAGGSLDTITTGMGSVSTSLGNAGTGFGTIASSISGMKDNNKSNTTSTFSIFGNITVAVKRFFDSLKDMMGKMTFSSSSVSKMADSARAGAESGINHVMHAISSIP